LNGTNVVTLVAAPATSTRRIVKNINIQNRDTAAVTVTVGYLNNASTRQIAKVTMQPGDTLTFGEEDFYVLDSTLKSITAVMSASATTTNPDFVACWADTANAVGSAFNTPAGGSLAGSYPNPTIASGAVVWNSISSGTIYSGGTINFTNYIINGGFRYAQRIVPTNTASLFNGTADGYYLDRWKMCSPNLATSLPQIWRTDQLTSGKTSGLDARYYGVWTLGASGNHGAMYQPIEAGTSQDLNNKVVTFQAKMRCGSSAQSGVLFKMGFVQANSGMAADIISPSIVSGTGAVRGFTVTSGTNPTWGSGMSLLGTETVVQLTDLWQVFTNTVQHLSGGVNLIPTIWTNNPTIVSGVQLWISEVGAYEGGGIRTWQPRLEQQELALCQRYYEKSFDIDTATANNSGLIWWQFSYPATSGFVTINQNYKVQKFKGTGSVSVTDTSGNANVISTINLSTITANVAATVDKTSQYGFRVFNTAGAATAQGIVYGFTAEAEI
jgi:hypothetical protein